MRWLFSVLISIHGLIHLLGAAKAFGLADLPQLSQPVTRENGILWLAAGAAMLATALGVFWAPRGWWMVGVGALLVSQYVIGTSWRDAKFGTVANVILVAGIVYGFMSQGPLSLRADYRRAVEARLHHQPASRLLTEADLEGLPLPVQRYIRFTGAVGQPVAHRFRALWRGRIRQDENDPWMEFTAEQYNFLDDDSRFFFMDARRSGLPVDVLHAFQDGSATMRVRLLSLFPLVNAGGPEATRAETVTLFNDLCLLSPNALIDPNIQWEAIDDRSVRAQYTVGSNTITARLVFNDAGELIDFVSDDRLAASKDGTTFLPLRWSTPVRDYRVFGSVRAPSHGEGRWHTPEGDYTYIELELLELEINGDRVEVGDFMRRQPDTPTDT